MSVQCDSSNTRWVVRWYQAARDELAGRGVDVSEVQDSPGTGSGFFSDGNRWNVQQIPPRD